MEDQKVSNIKMFRSHPKVIGSLEFSTHRELRINPFILVQILLDHKREQLRNELRVSSLVRACRVSAGKIGSPSTAAFRRWRGTRLLVRFEGAEGEVVCWHVVPDVRELVESDADICYLQTVKFTHVAPNASS